MNYVIRKTGDGTTLKKYYDGSTRTYYFETFVSETKLIPVLNKYLEDGLSYYRYLPYSVSDEKTQKWNKIIGVLQFNNRVAKSALQQKFVTDNVYIDVLQPATRPTVLVMLKMYVIGERHGLTWANTKSSDTPFGFGGRKTKHEGRYMRPYLKALTLYKDYDKPDFPYKNMIGAKKICKFKYRLCNSLIRI